MITEKIFNKWIFLLLFDSYYCLDEDKAQPISKLIASFEAEGNVNVNANCDNNIPEFSADEWNAMGALEKEEVLLKYRLTYLSDTEVNWCSALGTVLANDEIIKAKSFYLNISQKTTLDMNLKQYKQYIRELLLNPFGQIL